MVLYCTIIISIVSFVAGQVNTGCNPTVDVKDGTYIGRYQTTAKNVSFASFQGIPFAEPPIGNLRFKDPILVTDLRGVFNATEIGPICIQPNGTGVMGSEDCLNLNIFVPLGVNRPKRGFPVFFYIHGGGFTNGDTNPANVELLIETGFIFVGLNYRVGPMGFLSLGTSEVPGNAGVKDQTICLRWIRKNVRYFGGDANNVMLFGVSAGAVSAQLQQLSLMAKGLFSKIITVSGAALVDWAIQTRPSEKAAQLADILGLNISSLSFLNDIQNVNAADIVLASLLVQPFKPGAIQDFAFTPVVEATFKGTEAFLTMMPIEYYKTGKYNHVPILIGCTSKEGVALYGGDLEELAILLTLPSAVVPLRWQNILPDDVITELYEEIMQQYFGRLNVDLTNRGDFESAIDLYGDVGDLKPTEDTVRALVKTSRAPVYHHIFSFTGVLNGMFMLPLGLIGATHANEGIYISAFENPRIGEFTPDGWTRRTLLKICENFSKSSNPTTGSCTHLLPTKWLPVTNTKINYLEINGALTPSVNPAECRMKFWRELEFKIISGKFN